MLSRNQFKALCVSRNRGQVEALLSTLPDNLKLVGNIVKNKSNTISLEIILDSESRDLNIKIENDLEKNIISFGISAIEKFHTYLNTIIQAELGEIGKIERFQKFYFFRFNCNGRRAIAYEIIDLPEILYHYTTAEAAVAILEMKSILFSHRNLFNDPFDTHLQEGLIKPDLDYKKIESLIKGKIGNSFELCGQKELQANLNEFIAKIDKGIASQRFLCLGREYDSPSMWHHYSKAYSGVVFGFSTQDRGSEWDLFFEKENKDIKQMLYTSHSQIYLDEEAIAEYVCRHYIFRQGNKEKNSQDFQNWLEENYIIPACKEKSIAWEYEQEFRVTIVPKN